MRVFIPVLVALVLAASAALAACGDDGDPGFRGPDGACVTWCTIGDTCAGGSATCHAENISSVLRVLMAIDYGDPSLPPCQGCGCKGGPGYRDDEGHCVGWDDLQGRCGTPPTTLCKAEIVSPNADTAAAAQAEYTRLRADCP